MKKFMIFCMALLFVSGTGCTTRMIDFTVISSKNVEWSKANSYVRGKKRVKGEDKAHIIIFIPTGNPNVKEAVDKAIESMPGCVALLDGVIDYKWFYIPYIYGQSAYIVEGTPLIDPSVTHASLDISDQYIVAQLDENGNILNTRSVDKAEFEEIKADIL